MKNIFLILFLTFSLYGQISQKGIDLISYYEGNKLVAYRCPASVWTIGRGHTKDVYEGMRITQAQSDLFLIQDTKEFYEYVKRKIPKGVPTNETDAYISVCFNAGYVLKGRFLEAINRRQHQLISYHNSKICKAKVRGQLKILPGLVRRRTSENILRTEDRLDFVKGN